MLLNFFRQYFLVSSTSSQRSDSDRFRISALRILLTSCLLVFGSFTLHSLVFNLNNADDYLIPLISAAYICVLSLLLYLSSLHIKLTASIFIGLLALTGWSLALFSEESNAVKFGLTTLYSLPLMVRLFFSFKASLICSLANCATFVLELSESHYFSNLDAFMSPTFSAFYFQLLIFVLLNFGLPLAVSRILHTLQMSLRRFRDLTARLNHHTELYEEIFEHTGTPTILCDKKGKVLKLNEKAEALLTKGQHRTIEGTRINDWLSSTSDSSNRYFWQKDAAKCALRTDAKSFLEVHRSALTTHGHYVLHLQDVTHLRALTQELESTQQTNSRLTHFDSLTRLPNHTNFCMQVNHRISHAQDYYTGAMFIIRISQFKLLNKQYGREQANRVILHFSKSLQERLSDTTITGRLRGVKFACFMPVGQTYLIQRNLRALIKSILPEQIKIGTDLLNIDYQIGVSYYTNEGEKAEELLERCEMALEYSTSAERISFFDQQLEAKLVQEHKLGLALAQAVKDKSIDIWLQPQVTGSGEIRSFEALARWKREDGSYISPITFIKLAEELGLLPKLAESLLKKLVAVLEAWHEEHIKTPIAFNLAGQELMNDGFFALLMSLTSDRPWLSDMLELEITETSPVMTHSLIHKRLRTLSQYGFSIAIDDFGTGQASLGQLIDIPANILKIDRRFVSPLPDDRRHYDIVKSTIQLAKSLNMSVIAEGIETREQANLLVGLGCDTLQGYYYGKPCPITEWTDNNNEKAKELRMVY
ncbi:GGDEF domain-containing protein [Marinomonas piezotolerans]|uniref:GGDEF domain-containing protein n=1 Tax=Marinomonas piezotolerans TaxID=2213058 RepID=A0A370UD46_9GAMM|nr:GGDEF domain-containing phosphodiesterase [Marinomonas piezotolerans]RDL45671.1 GGDEF domain-containing protein [Marinomonas piezotolerans]